MATKEAVPEARLWELGDLLEQIGAEILDAEGELTPELEARLDALECAWTDKVERVALMAQGHKGKAAEATIEFERFQARLRRHQRAEASLKAYLQRELERLGKDRVETPRATVRLQTNGRPSIKWPGDIRQAPPEFVRVLEPEIDGNAAYAAWKKEALPEGFVIERGRHLRVS